MLCGKIASGKSTLTKTLAAEANTVLLSEDHWLARLYPGEINTVEDYIRSAARLREAISGHITQLLGIGVSVVLDFPANTPSLRQWMRSLFEAVDANHQLHFVDVPEEICKARLRARNASGSHDFAASDADFGLITSYFVPPHESEGFNLILYGATQGARDGYQASDSDHSHVRHFKMRARQIVARCRADPCGRG
jgi:predicted kinase